MKNQALTACMLLYFGLLRMTKAAITPGTQPIKVNTKTIRMLPKPLSKTANGGNNTLKITLKMLIALFILFTY